jgi:adenylosuccinate synthase
MAVTAVLGTQWGDEGKGKIVDLMAADASVVARYQGGPNAGHTVVVKGEQIILHQIPSGILQDDVRCMLGNGCVIDPLVLFDEIERVKQRGIEVRDRLFISEKAHLIMPYHRAIDEASESRAGKGAIGTTGRGIGPAYTDKYARTGIRVLDLLDKKHFADKLRANVEDKNCLLRDYYKGGSELNVDKIVSEYETFAERLKPFVADVSLLLYDAIRRKQDVVIEGAQGTLLDVDHGTYPFVTSSNPTAGGASTGLGIGPRHIDKVYGIIKAYTTRVGNGPFPTELDDPLQTQFREWGGEFGATTGRARRCGWLDLVIAKYAARVNSLDAWVITKLDVLSHLDKIQVCTGYRYRGEKIEHFPSEPWKLAEVAPVYETLPGWEEDISDVREYGRLPVNCRDYLDFIVEQTGVPIRMVSVGPDRDATVPLRSM